MNRSSNQEGCNCHSTPPCSYCVDTFTCKVCGDRVDASEWNKDQEETCELCVENNGSVYENKISSARARFWRREEIKQGYSPARRFRMLSGSLKKVKVYLSGYKNPENEYPD